MNYFRRSAATQKRADPRDCFVRRRRHMLAQSNMQLIDGLRLAADKDHVCWKDAQRLCYS